jgi:hypothetical protein
MHETSCNMYLRLVLWRRAQQICNSLLVCSTFRVVCPVVSYCECDNGLDTNESSAQFNLILSLRLRMSSTWSLTFGLSFRNLYGFLSNACYMITSDFIIVIIFPLPMARQPLVGQGLLIVEDSRWHSNTQQSVELPWMGDQPNTETYLYLTTHNILKRKTSMSSAGFVPTFRTS